MMDLRKLLGPCLLTVSLMAIGCGGSDPYSHVPFSGTVTYEGNPVQQGGIVAIPKGTAASGDSKQPTAQAAIADGKFEFLDGSRPGAGSYMLEITVNLPGENTGDAPAAEIPEGEPVNPGQTVLCKKQVTIPDGGDENFAIDLTKADQGEPER